VVTELSGPAVLSASVSTERDVFTLRRDGRAVAELLGVDKQDQVRLATALSELGRDLLGARGLTARFTVEEPGENEPPGPPALVVALTWQGPRTPGTEALDAAGRLVRGLTHRPGTSRVLVEQQLTAEGGPAEERAAAVQRGFHPVAGPTLAEELRSQTQDLIAALAESQAQREELRLLNQELEETNQGVLALYSQLSEELAETNRGVVALYAEIDEKTRQLRQASEAKTRFWANVSHELRTPVNAVVGLARLLLGTSGEAGDGLDGEQRHQLGLIAASGDTLLALVDELLDVAKAESGRLEPQPAPVDLRTLLARLRGEMGGVPTQDGVALVVPDPADPPELVTDEVMLTRVLRNLLSNGLKFTGHGEVRLDIGTARPPGEDREVVFTVTDTGVGIPADQQERVFEEFYQVRGPHQRGRSGTGLGLPYARRLTELLGGRIALRSAPGEGTSVTVRLPARPPVSTVRPTATETDDGDGDAGGGAARVTEKLAVVLTADDDPAFRAAFRPLLRELAHRVVEVDRGADVPDAVRRERPGAVLLDLHMPDTDGYQVLDRLAADPALDGVPVIVVTSADGAHVDRSRLTRARAVVGKSGLTSARLAALITTPPTGYEPSSGPDGPPPRDGEPGAGRGGQQR
jgi:signal transduction histidine kinase